MSAPVRPRPKRSRHTLRHHHHARGAAPPAEERDRIAAQAARRLLEGRRIVVLCGGPSAERAVSLKSGAAVAGALERAGQSVERVVIGDAEDTCRRLDQLAACADGIDVAFIALHGEFGEDGQLQQVLEARGVPYVGAGPLSSRMCMDKSETKRALCVVGISTPAFAVIARRHKAARARSEAARVGFPLVVKPNRAGSSLGVSIVRDAGRLMDAVNAAFQLDALVLLETFTAGRELTVGVLDGEALPVIEVGAPRELFDYQAKYADGGTTYTCPADLDPVAYESARSVAEYAFEQLHCRDLARVDMILSAGEILPQVIEVNTIPGLTDHSLFPMAARARGIDMSELCLRLAAAAYARARSAPSLLRKAS